VKREQLLTGVMAALVLASPLALAESDYPAANFQPKVVYSDSNYKAEPTQPAAVAPVVENDPNFPAANYQPKVLFNDPNYKHSSAAPVAPGASRSAAASAPSTSAAVETSAPAKSGSSDTTLFGLIALAAVAGYFLMNKKGGSSTTSGADYSVGNDGATGVEKYLEKMGANKTGVAKYLEKQTEVPATGVSRYMAKQVVKDREAAAAKATGVEKYLRDNG